MQSIRFYVLLLVSIATGAFNQYVTIIIVPHVMVALLARNKLDLAVTFAWGAAALVGITLISSYALYYGELLALDWRKALTRKVSHFKMIIIYVGFQRSHRSIVCMMCAPERSVPPERPVVCQLACFAIARPKVQNSCRLFVI